MVILQFDLLTTKCQNSSCNLTHTPKIESTRLSLYTLNESIIYIKRQGGTFHSVTAGTFETASSGTFNTCCYVGMFPQLIHIFLY